jgi:FAD:protein FMN transferase
MTSHLLCLLWLCWISTGIHQPLHDFSDIDRSIESQSVPAGGRVAGGGDNDTKTVSKVQSRRVYLMGTLCTLHYVSHSPEKSVGRMESMVRILESTEEELSTWKEDSIISRLNRQPVGVPLEVDPSMIKLFKELHYWAKETEQAFEPTVGKLLEAYAVKTGGRWPAAASIEAAKQNTGMQHYILDKKGYRIARTRSIQMDAGSFGKGEALDRLLKVHAGDDAWMADLGGQVLVHGSPPGKSGWQVAIAHPRNRGDAILSIVLRSGSLATSGGSERDQKVDDRRLGHVLNPRTGKPAPFNGSVSVWHERALTADILSTALYVMGPERGLSWAEDRNIAACFLVPDGEENVKVLASQPFRKIAPGYSFTNR